VSPPNRKASQDIRYRLADNSKRLRKARGYTQERLAKLCGFTKTYISNVEQGTVNISLANLEALTNGLDCTAEDLLRRQK
jgi:transcriptional regulator with XRE-family HTH domain